MSWTTQARPYQAFADEATNVPAVIAFPQWTLSIFDVTSDHPEGHWHLETTAGFQVCAARSSSRRDALLQITEMFHILSIPGHFIMERVQSVSHSFGRKSDKNGFCSWFHFLCKDIDIRALPRVSDRLNEFITSRSCDHVTNEPYILFDLILEGLFYEVDDTLILESANSKNVRKISSRIPFAALHNYAKHIIHIAEALASCVRLVDATIQNVGDHPQIPRQENSDQVIRQLQECLQYRRSLSRSSQLRLGSLQKRIDNAITLSFNLVTQQDSLVMIQDSNSMKVIAAITMIFLLTTGVATIIGSQLFLANPQGDKSWDVLTTRLFWAMWWVSIPLTIFVVILAIIWNW
ncbi:hypothetical protein B0J13DRAFT_595924 [Dactylonectria estremocensis]|uniref:Uncharacterized protein n=1 Tax=Dactylonectria estremocensis TaxID=1079267 RepID=A0A9P9EV99_9HYPO|nr:hypothetical protein B0J13DRAFT_595924 [Dactylonectria estremocensis]